MLARTNRTTIIELNEKGRTCQLRCKTASQLMYICVSSDTSGRKIFFIYFVIQYDSFAFCGGQWCQKTKQTLRFEEVRSIIYYLTCIKHKRDTHHKKININLQFFLVRYLLMSSMSFLHVILFASDQKDTWLFEAQLRSLQKRPPILNQKNDKINETFYKKNFIWG